MPHTNWCAFFLTKCVMVPLMPDSLHEVVHTPLLVLQKLLVVQTSAGVTNAAGVPCVPGMVFVMVA